MAAHGCKQEGVLGAMQATLEARAEADARIESGLKNLVDQVRQSQTDTTTRLAEMNTHFVQIQTVLEEQTKNAATAAKTQNEIKEAVTNLSQRVTKVEARMSAVEATASAIEKKAATTDTRLKAVEKWIVRAAAIVATIFGMMQLGSNMDAIKTAIFPELKQLSEQGQEFNHE